jgi:S1-C subfamily serine protease/regulator of sirC expression with transglutaminase-like and TPR domain
MRLLLLTAPCLVLAWGAVAATPEGPPLASIPESRTVEELTASSRPSLVTITQIGRGGSQEALGTGFVAGKDGLIATNLHVIGNARRITVQLMDGSKHEVTEIHATDPALDLAVIRIGKKDLPPLPLGDSDTIQQGQTVIALGNPQGLEYSVVDGVVSAVRDVEGTEMIQVAMPIEEGNSGGPVLDLAGRVLGVVTLKSAVTENLGFAHTVNELRLLLEKPNPVPMSRWLTIGRLDSRTWSPQSGATWTQHAGIIHVEGTGSGFGGRSLCLNNEAPPELPYEASVTVKLDDEAGAAGLAFCSDGGDVHYGFYPSAGKLRLTRFDGPDVYSWTILSDAASPAYRPGAWNTLRIRVDEEKIQCFVNDTLVTEQHDAELRGGKLGLCKFRQTKARFKRFQAGTKVGPPEIPPALAAHLEGELSRYLDNGTQKDATMERLLATPAAARSLLEQRTRTLEDQIAALRRLDSEMHRRHVTDELASLLNSPDGQTDLLKAALLVARHDNPELDVEVYLKAMDRMVDELKTDPAIRSKSTARAAKRLVDYLFLENGFHGSRSEAIDDLSNSYLDQVLDDREGIPITLSIVFIELARRLGLEDIYGVSLPGRFMVAYKERPVPEPPATTRAAKTKSSPEAPESVEPPAPPAAAPVRSAPPKAKITYVDVFDGGKLLQPDQAEEFIMETTGQMVDESHRHPAAPRAMILRLLYNLTSFSKKPEQSLPYLDLILTLDPDSPGERLNRAFTRMRTGDKPGAKEDLKALLESAPAGLDLQRIDALYQSL